MIAIPGGTFLIGSSLLEDGRADDEWPRRRVVIRPFWMGKTEVTWDEYNEFRKGGFVSNRTNAEALAKNVDAITRPTPPYPDETRGFGREGYPAIGISHHAAMEYCYWLSKKTGKTYRLPTEAEWEYACRAGTVTAYFFGDDPQKLARYEAVTFWPRCEFPSLDRLGVGSGV
jgi:formylglycine-generating enzyme required for sulfatase activity